MADSVATNNSSVGFTVATVIVGRPGTILTLTRSQAVGNGFGVVVDTFSTLWLAQSAIVGNTTLGYYILTSGTINSFGDNYIASNGGNFSLGSFTTVGTQ